MTFRNAIKRCRTIAEDLEQVDSDAPEVEKIETARDARALRMVLKLAETVVSINRLINRVKGKDTPDPEFL